MARPNSPDMPPKRTKKVQELGLQTVSTPPQDTVRVPATHTPGRDRAFTKTGRLHEESVDRECRLPSPYKLERLQTAHPHQQRH
ncbi:hypothetical protein ACROYT_G001953 [Oculina patagonica]